MEPQTSRKDYKNHQYSGPRKSRKRSRGQMIRYHGEDIKRCLAAYEAANRNLEKARAKNKDVHAAEQAQAAACARFEELSARAREELIDFRARRVAAFKKSLIDLAELEIKHARAQQELFRKSLQVLKECQ